MNSKSAAGASSPLRGKTVPRLWTKPLRELTEETTFGFEAIEFIEKQLGRGLHPWQKWFLIHSMELKEGSFTWSDFPIFRFKTVVLLVARQNGKSYIMSSRLLWRMLMWDGPEENPPLVLGTAHKLRLAEEILDLSFNALKKSAQLRRYIAKKKDTNGNKLFQLTNGARYVCESASDDGGRGLSVIDLAFDELRQQREWSAWSAMTNTTNAIHSSQVIAVSNAGEAKSDVLRSLREKALKEIEERAHAEHDSNYYPQDPSLGLFEYSAPDDCDIWDREGWAQANPSLGFPFGPTEDTLASQAALVGEPGAGMPEHKFRTENLCQWVQVAEDGIFKQEDIDECTDEASEIAPDSPLYLGFDVSKDRSMTYIAVAGWRDDGLPHVEVIARRAYTEWVPKYLAEKLAFTPEAYIAQGRGAPVSTILDFVEQEGTEVTRCEGTHLPNSCGQFYDRVIQHTIRWGNQPDLLLALAEAQVKTMGDSWIFNRDKSPVDIAPLCAASVALWGLTTGVKKEKTASAYTDEYEKWW